MNQNISKMLIGKSRKFLAPYVSQMDAWRREFVPQLVKGMIQAGGLVVTEIARSLQKPGERLEAVWQRIRRHVGSREWEKFENQVREEFAQDQVSGIDEWTPIAVDLSDISKPYAKKMEYLATVRDADESSLRGTRVLNAGYWQFESYVTAGKNADPLPVVCFPFSVEDPRVGSQNRALEEGFELLQRVLKGKGILILDRGFDGDNVFGLVEEKRLHFVCRLVGGRILLNADRVRIGIAHDVAERMALTHQGDFRVWKNHKWKRQRLEFGWRSVRLPDTHELYTSIVVGRPGQDEVSLMLLTNVSVRSFHDVIKLIKRYFLRWRAEDAIRMLKKELGLETVRVLDFNSIRRLIEFAFWILAMITCVTLELTEDQKKKVTRLARAWPTPVLLFHYRVLALFQRILAAHGPDFLSLRCRKEAEV